MTEDRTKSRDAAPWARASNDVKKPQSPMCDSCRKLDFKIFVKQNGNILCFSHTSDSEASYCTKKFKKANKTKIIYISDNHIEYEVSLHFWGVWPTVRRWPRIKCIIRIKKI